MSTNGRKGNRTSIPARGARMRGNTAPPPSVRLGAEDPISTSRPRGNEAEIPALPKPPADILAAAAAPRAEPEPEPTAKTPPVAAAPAAQAAPAREPLPTLVSAAQASSVARVSESDEGPMSQAPASLSPRSMTGAPGAVRRKGRGSNLRRSAPPPSMTGAPAPAASIETVPSPVVTNAPPPSSKPASEKTARVEQAAESKAAEASKAGADAPVSAHPPSDVDHHFFERGDHDHHHGTADDDLETYDEKLARKNSPEARARREKNMGVIKWVVAAVAAIGVVGVYRHATTPIEEPPVVVTVVPPKPPTAATTVTNAEPSIGAAPAPSGAAEPAASGAPVASGAPAGSAAIPVASAEDLPTAPTGSARFQEQTAPLGSAAKSTGLDPTSGTPALPAAMSEPTEAEKKSAAQEKHTCQSFLDQGAFGKAIEAGERSVALDPADGEAWLLLGAAYQSMGKGPEARRSFSSCVAEGKKGPINECRAMLH